MSVAVRLCSSILLLIPFLGGCSGESVPDDTPPRHVLLISLDTLRADHCGFLGYHQPTTPFLDSLAARGVVFENHHANSNCTLPSHATMLTGLFVPTHGVIFDESGEQGITPVPSSAPSLAKRFSEAGYETRAITAHQAWLNELYGFDQGFDHFVSSWRNARVTLNEYLKLVDESQSGRTFTFLHFFDIHSDTAQEGPCLPYRANSKFVAEFAGPVPEGFTGCASDEPNVCASAYLQKVSREREPLPADHLAFLIGLYDAGIRQLDENLERLFGALDERGLLEETLIVITSDHGEAFQEHGTMLHDSYHNEESHVPLIIVPPSRFKVPPRRIYSRTQSTDLAPTILDLCRLNPIGQTSSLAKSVMLGTEPEPGTILFGSGVLIGEDEISEFKYATRGRRQRPIFYDRTADPEETVDLMQDDAFREANKLRIERIGRELHALNSRCWIARKGLELERNPDLKLPPKLRAELEALGYAGDGESKGKDADD